MDAALRPNNPCGKEVRRIEHPWTALEAVQQLPGFGGFETVGSAIQIIACHAIGHMGGLTVVRAPPESSDCSSLRRNFARSKEVISGVPPLTTA